MIRRCQHLPRCSLAASGGARWRGRPAPQAIRLRASTAWDKATRSFILSIPSAPWGDSKGKTEDISKIRLLPPTLLPDSILVRKLGWLLSD